MTPDLRALSFLNWLENELFLTIQDYAPASSDASFRRYFRVFTPEGQFIVMDAPPDKENLAPFIKVAALMQRSGVRVPAIYQENRGEGFLLLEDFGSASFLEAVSAHNADDLYGTAFDSLLRLQTETSLLDEGLPCYDRPLLVRELTIFDEWFLTKLHGIQMPAKCWLAVCDRLIASALEQPIVCVHRDYHSRNLMVLNDNSLGVIDFQDAVVGPITYDVVSLLRDCYIAWPAPQVHAWLENYYDRLVQQKIITCSFNQFKRWFDLMGMQRHLKAIGIFSRLHLRDGKSGYLGDIPRTLAYVVNVCQEYPELTDFYHFLADYVLPVYKVSP